MRQPLIAAALAALVLTSATLIVELMPTEARLSPVAAPLTGEDRIDSAQRPRSDASRARKLLDPDVASAEETPSRAPSQAPPARDDDTRTVDVGDEVVFRGDYANGDFSRWGTCQSVVLNSSCNEVDGSHYSMQIVNGPGSGVDRFAARFVVRDGDNPGFAGGERSEVSAGDGADVGEGDERWYEWSMRFPEEFTNPEGWWFIVMQWHHNGSTGSPPLVINISNEGTVDIGGDGVDHPKRTIGPVRPGEWVDYVLHVKFSRDSDTGFVEAWENGVQTVEKTHRATMVDDGNYLKQGIYRDEDDEGTAEVAIAGLRVTAP